MDIVPQESNNQLNDLIDFHSDKAPRVLVSMVKSRPVGAEWGM